MSKSAGWPMLPRLLVQITLLALAPGAAVSWGLDGLQLGFVAGSTLMWSLLEMAIAFKVRAVSQCRNFPFLVRLLCSYGLGMQVLWFSGADVTPGVQPEYASLMDNISVVLADNAKADPPVPKSITTLSVVLPCANEGEYVKKTLKAVFEATPSDQLKEIIVVDDASHPSVMSHLTEEELTSYRGKVIRHSVQEGLIRSKKDGGDAAQGDAVVFLDCHVKPMDDWTGPILANLRENPRRIVVPAITSLDPDTWQEVSPYGGGTKMCLTWDADFFWCNEYPGPFVPIMSGGLLAMTKFWWESIGGYDSEMKAWGGENLDQSLRTWLCGGEIRVAEGSRVAHMWRDPSKPKTMLRYRIPTNDVRRNRLRAAAAWLDGWADKVRTFPQFEDFAEGGPLTIGSLENMEYYRRKLKCKSFDFYLNKFRDFYIDTGLVPAEVFNLKEHSSGLCLSLRLANGKSSGFSLAPCSATSELQRFHEANRGSRKRCCSGMKTWDFDACLVVYGQGNEVASGSCDHFGYSPNQHLKIKAGALIWKRGDGCVVPKVEEEPKHERGREAVFSASSCLARMEGKAGSRATLRVHAAGLCLQVQGEKLRWAACTQEKAQEFETVSSFRGGEVVLKASSGLCVQRQGQKPIAGPCESAEQFRVANRSLVLSREVDGQLLYLCTALPPPQAVGLAQCASEDGTAKPGQGFQRRNSRPDGTFQIFEEQMGLCLRPERRGGQNVLVSAPCPEREVDQTWRWFYNERAGQLKHAGLGQCVDAFDFKEFIIYPCYDPGQNAKQRYLFRTTGNLEMPRTWADNGRLRYPSQCLDTDPIKPEGVAVSDCAEASRRGVSWERVWTEVPLETRLWKQAAGKHGFLA